PHCDPMKYRRLHVIVGDANMSEIATFLKLGTTAILLAMIEDEQLDSSLVLATPVAAIRQISHDPTLRQKILLESGKTFTALELQDALCERAERYAERFGLESVGEEDGKLILRRWREVIEGLKEDPVAMRHVVDWVAKKRIVDGMSERHNLRANDLRLKAIDLQYHDMRADKCLALRENLETLTDKEDVLIATTTPPDSTRAYFRGMCLKKWPTDVVAANWDSIVFDIGREPLRRVPMMEPLRGTRQLTESLIAQSSSPSELVAALGDQVSSSSFKPTN
ncbi:MAG: proteasome accessory factor PafA2 family protein, partial [Acidimicrobiaceae bacterium]